MEIRKATYSDISALMNIFEGAKAIMRKSGNIHQWNGNYPTEAIVSNDIDSGNCFVLCDEGNIIGTMALIEGPDHTYAEIDGDWLNEEPYHVIHRIATAAEGRKVAQKMFDWAFENIGENRTIRIDTHRDNCIMKHILSKYGFQECGVIYLRSGDPRDAYQLTV